jgi:hypothetical protein
VFTAERDCPEELRELTADLFWPEELRELTGCDAE